MQPRRADHRAWLPDAWSNSQLIGSPVAAFVAERARVAARERCPDSSKGAVRVSSNPASTGSSYRGKAGPLERSPSALGVWRGGQSREWRMSGLRSADLSVLSSFWQYPLPSRPGAQRDVLSVGLGFLKESRPDRRGYGWMGSVLSADRRR